MNKDHCTRTIRLVIRSSLLTAFLLSLFMGASRTQVVHAAGTGSISGTIRQVGGAPFTGISVQVQAVDTTGSNPTLASTCTNRKTGAYTIGGVPTGSSVAVYVVGGIQCNFDSSFYGWSYWSTAGDVSNLPDATPILLTDISPTVTGIDLVLGEAVPVIEYFAFNLDHANLDQSVRQAIAYGTDRLHILDTAWLPASGEYGTVENSYVADNHWAVATPGNSALPTYPYNPAQAAALLEADGWLVNPSTGIREKLGQPLSISFKTTTRASRQAVGGLFVAEMQAIGIQVTATYYDPGFFFGPSGPLATRDFDIVEYTINYCRNTLDETCVPFAMYHNGDENNTAHYNSPAAETEYAAFQAATTHAERLTHAIAHQVIAMGDLPYLPLFTRTEPLTIRGNAGVGRATLSWTDGTLKSVTASGLGVYKITVPLGWSGTITPSRAGRIFKPASRSYFKLTSSKTGQDFTTRYIVTFRSIAKQDGWILESSETSNRGGTLNATDPTFNLGDDSLNRQYRAVLSFNTAGLPDTAVIQSAVLSIEQSGPPTGTSPFDILGTLTVDIGNPSFGTVPALKLSDFNAPPSAAKVGAIGSVPTGSWYSGPIGATGRSFINKTGLTQFRLRFALDDNNDLVADFMSFFSGDAATTDRPTLTIIYTLP